MALPMVTAAVALFYLSAIPIHAAVCLRLGANAGFGLGVSPFEARFALQRALHQQSGRRKFPHFWKKISWKDALSGALRALRYASAHVRIERIRLNGRTGERYMFIPADTSILSVRKAFERYTEKNSRLGMVFVTETGSAAEQLICMLTPWDVLSVEPAAKEGGDYGGKAELREDDGAL